MRGTFSSDEIKEGLYIIYWFSRVKRGGGQGYICRTSVPDFLELYRQMRGKIQLCSKRSSLAWTNVSRLRVHLALHVLRSWIERESVPFYREHQSILWLRHCAFSRFTYSLRGKNRTKSEETMSFQPFSLPSCAIVLPASRGGEYGIQLTSWKIK